ncbi:MAG TPA: hypothetical protein RMH99_20565 [Sandaracinaceae bacterium LLY-WYZ-13_1]|nr:hypothetical protein [Sandaracinaceae bacterium LLY-WYZ-13_1]
MRCPVWVGLLVLAGLLGGCAETVRCPEGEIFDEAGECVSIPDGGPPTDGGAPDGG